MSSQNNSDDYTPNNGNADLMYRSSKDDIGGGLTGQEAFSQRHQGSPLLTLREDRLATAERTEDDDQDMRTYVNPAVVGPTTGVFIYGTGVGDKAREGVERVKEHVHNGVERVKEKLKGE